MNGLPESDPLMFGMSVTDLVTGIYGAVGTLAALQYRERTGKGQVVDISLLDVSTSLLLNTITNYYQLGIATGRIGNQDCVAWPANIYTARDGRKVYMHSGNDDMFLRFCAISGNEQLVKDERFNHLVGGRSEHIEECDRIIQTWMSKYDSEEIVEILQTNGIAAAHVNDISETAQNPKLIQRGTIRKVVDPMLGEMMITGPVVKMSKSDPDVYRTAPYIGRDNYEVYRKVLGMTIEEIGRMEDEGLI